MSSFEDTLNDTVPGRIFLSSLQKEYQRSEEYLRTQIEERAAAFISNRVARAVSEYLYSDVPEAVTREDFKVDLDRNLALALEHLVFKSIPFDSPQVHYGDLTRFRNVSIFNRVPVSTLPGGAFWTAPITGPKSDTWRGRSSNKIRSTIIFNTKLVRLAQIDGLKDWINLINLAPEKNSGKNYPDWTAISYQYDAVFLSPAGLLLAHPHLSQFPFHTVDGTGVTHSQSGPYPGVGEWSAVSTAWMRVPCDARIEPS
ncbi:hypothetical protein [Rhodococcus chondri]|uniref:Uncharacterized protein n=1 Tax=Rhodococcus chondri TaxID=3065941 RepID=A0ABU7JVQ6_9NOCA|nr:hypothetical protein [Rhodococcus sp. CC-R104]MEE2033999.1 hypothetical protein [Rhodococcus sp. CC-R104]